MSFSFVDEGNINHTWDWIFSSQLCYILFISRFYRVKPQW